MNGAKTLANWVRSSLSVCVCARLWVNVATCDCVTNVAPLPGRPPHFGRWLFGHTVARFQLNIFKVMILSRFFYIDYNYPDQSHDDQGNSVTERCHFKDTTLLHYAPQSILLWSIRFVYYFQKLRLSAWNDTNDDSAHPTPSPVIPCLTCINYSFATASQSHPLPINNIGQLYSNHPNSAGTYNIGGGNNTKRLTEAIGALARYLKMSPASGWSWYGVIFSSTNKYQYKTLEHSIMGFQSLENSHF